jgi:hypothetical protein
MEEEPARPSVKLRYWDAMRKILNQIPYCILSFDDGTPDVVRA